MERTKIEGPNGLKIAVSTHYPKGSRGKMAILCPGYLDSKDYDHISDLAETLKDEGYAVARFDPVGTWDSEGEISSYTMKNYFACIRSVKHWMQDRSDYSYDFFLIAGHSRGGGMAIIYGSQDKDVSAIVGIMPSTGVKKRKADGYKSSRISKRDIPGKPAKFREYEVSKKQIQEFYEWNAFDAVHDIDSPILLIAGEDDEVIPLKEVKSLYKKANEPKTLTVMENMGHDYRHNKSEIRQLNQKIVDWIHKEFGQWK